MPRYAHPLRQQPAPTSRLDKREARPASTYSNAKLIALFALCAMVAYANNLYRHHPQVIKQLKQGELTALWRQDKSPAPSADPLRRPVEDYAAEIHAYFEREQFDILEQLVAQLRRSKQRLVGGEWKLAAFYQGLRPTPLEKEEPSRWPDNLRRLEKWAKQYPASATPLIAMVDNFAQLAEPIKTKDELNKLPLANRQQLNEGIEVSLEAMEAAKNTQTNDPHLYAATLELGKLANWDKAKFEEVYQAGVELEPAYQHLHQAKAIYLLPIWHGRFGETEDFAQTLAEKTGGQAGQQLYYLIALNLARRVPENEHKQVRLSLGSVKEGFKSLENGYGVDTKTLNEQGRLLTRNGDLAGANELFNRIGSNYDATVWNNKTEFESVRSTAAQAGNNELGALGNFNVLLLGAYGASLLLARSFLGAAAGPVTNVLTVGTLTGISADLNQQEQLNNLINYTREQIETLAAILDRASR
jgi:hypothetical protein